MGLNCGHDGQDAPIYDDQPRMYVEIHDTGLPLDPPDLAQLRAAPTPLAEPQRLFNLMRAQARAAAIDAELCIASAPGCGTRSLLLLPIA